MSGNARDFRPALRAQLRYLANSCALADRGHPEECIRVATAIRVLLHQTANSTALLTHLGGWDIQLLSTCRDINERSPHEPAGMVTHFFFGLGIMSVGPDGTTYAPKFGNGSSARLIGAREWWSQVTWVFDGFTITRREIVLVATNKDGGAHVDEELTPAYEALKRSVGGWVPNPPLDPAQEMTHLIALRQMGYELLNSPDLLALAE